ncbi:hypothetical protein JXL19_05305 [bacterium]|nr:hypothetical protein [bacterium]
MKWWFGKKVLFFGRCLLSISILINAKTAFSAENPHDRKKDRYVQACGACHAGNPIENPDRPPALKQPDELTKNCLSCHKKIPLSCSRAVTRDAAVILIEQIPVIALGLRDGSLACDSCHQFHSKQGRGMKQAYTVFLKQAEKINPHRAGIFCIFCHDREPMAEEEGFATLKYGGDRVKICTQCHNNKRARADNHPVNIYPSEGRGVIIDERFPLFDGKVTCITCHDIKCKGGYGETIPKFLRGGPYKERVDACLLCHQRESYKAVNPHDQIDKQGRLRKDRCQYCHILGHILKD